VVASYSHKEYVVSTWRPLSIYFIEHSDIKTCKKLIYKRNYVKKTRSLKDNTYNTGIKTILLLCTISLKIEGNILEIRICIET